MKIQTPVDQPMILVSAAPGSCRRFVSAIISHLINKDMIKISDLGNAHDNMYEFIDTSLDNHGPDVDANEIVKKFRIPEASIGLTPVIGPLHLVDFDPILAAYPNSKVVYVQMDESDRYQIGVNLFFKYMLEYSDRHDPNPRLTWEKDVFENPDIFPDNTITPWDITRDQTMKIVDRLSTIRFLSNWCTDIVHERILTIRFKDISTGNRKVIDDICRFIGMTPTMEAYMAMHRYARVQPDISELIQWFRS